MKRLFVIALLLATLLATPSARAEVRLASPFTSHMVLQCDRIVPVWGTADAGEKVTVKFAGQKRTAIADTNGCWRVNLKPMAASAKSRNFTVSGSKTAQPLQLDDVLVGEVWLASGQSNMDFSLSKKEKSFAGVTNEEQEIAAADHPLIRMFTGTAVRTNVPQSRVGGEWQVCTPANAPAFSAVGYFFARDLQREIKVPERRVVAIVKERRGLDADLCLRLARFFRMTPEFWMNLEKDFELETARLDWPRICKEVPLYPRNRKTGELKARQIA